MELPMRALVLDDDDLIGKAVARTLQMEGYEVVYEDTPFGALARLETEEFDLVVSDYNAGPGPRGTEVLKAAKHFHPEARRILMSGDAPEAIGDLDGATFVAKPFGLQEFRSKLLDSGPNLG